ncbi:MarR family transcriptional regulator [Asanoa ishikariensis]|uniref:DNA-binding transcriptional regulator, MarR family n=1 Tax=Asanoa ishikariensis TaxID=137265 RepID=A0A1H3R8A0_9ACTN|nr:MarR family transcriptional regulator [Asanoa ishikariensis]GIF64279.1 MarR family transcriptional regulator [Asanoa ishikariensis]SDZ22052.1 DNA-binding transcriptional regulator, MarR family [Asanoa ishikariensis]
MAPAAEDAETKRQRRRTSTAIKESLRELSVQLSLFNHQLSSHVDLRDSDLDCLDVIQRHGPLSPTALVRRTGLHAATMTGILDRLEKGGWIARDRDSVDRRAVVLRALRERNPEMFRLYSGMNTSMDKLLTGYTVDELETIADFVRRTTEAGKSATDDLTAG